jgi:hypothetical protein
MAQDPPSDPEIRAQLAAELLRRAHDRRLTGLGPGSEPAPQPVTVAPQPVTVTDIDMPFSSMVVFMLKWAMASIPAFLILFMIGLSFAAFLTALGRAI